MEKLLKERLIKHFEAEINFSKCGDKIYLITGKDSYTYNQVLEEIKNETSFAEILAVDLIAGTCYRLERSKRIYDSTIERAEEGETYYHITEYMEIAEDTEEGSERNNRHYNGKNYFLNHSDAVTARDMIQKYVI